MRGQQTTCSGVQQRGLSRQLVQEKSVGADGQALMLTVCASDWPRLPAHHWARRSAPPQRRSAAPAQPPALAAAQCPLGRRSKGRGLAWSPFRRLPPGGRCARPPKMQWACPPRQEAAAGECWHRRRPGAQLRLRRLQSGRSPPRRSPLPGLLRLQLHQGAPCRPKSRGGLPARLPSAADWPRVVGPFAPPGRLDGGAGQPPHLLKPFKYP